MEGIEMPRYQFTYYRVIEASVRVTAENEAEAIEIFETDEEPEFCIREGKPRFVKGPKEVLWESSLRFLHQLSEAPIG